MSQHLNVMLEMNQQSPVIFQQMMQEFLNQDNEVRNQAEQLYTELKSYPDQCTKLLTNAVRQSQDMAHHLRQMAAVLLRKYLTKGFEQQQIWRSLTNETKEYLKQELINCLNEDQNPKINKKVCDVVAEIYLTIDKFDDEDWPQLLPYIFNSVQQQDERMVNIGLMLFAEMGTYIMPKLKNYLSNMQQILQQNLCSSNKEIQVSSVRAIAAFVQGLNTKAERDQFSALLPGILQVLNTSLESDEDDAKEIIELLTEIAEADPRFLSKNLIDLTTLMLQVASNQNFDNGTRTLSIELLITLCEARDKAPGMMRKLPNFTAKVFEVLMSWLLDIEDTEEWYAAEDDLECDVGEGDLYEPGQEYLDRLSLAIGGKVLSPILGEILNKWHGAEDWKQRMAALICVAQVAEGCAKVLMQAATLSRLVTMCVAGLTDQHPRVRWAASQAIGQMCTDLSPKIQDNHHQAICEAFLRVLPDFNQPRVQAHVCSAIVNFSEHNRQCVEAHSDNLVQMLVHLLQNGKRLVQESALTALASIADTVQESFGRYYDTVVPMLMIILSQANDKSYQLMRAKALECISLVGLAVGIEKFRPDVVNVMGFIKTILDGQQQLDSDDPVLQYTMQAGARICKCLGKEFVEFLPLLMPQVLQVAAVPPEIRVKDNNDDEEAEQTDDDDIDTINMGDRRIEIRTSILEEKATACSMLQCYIEELGADFFPYLQQASDIILPLTTFIFHEDVRRSAMQCVPELYKCARDKGVEEGWQGPLMTQDTIGQYLLKCWKALTDGLEKEINLNSEGLVAVLGAIEGLVGGLEGGGVQLGMEQITEVFRQIEEVAKNSIETRKELQEKFEQNDIEEDDDEVLEADKQWEEEVMECVCNVIGCFLKHYKDAVYPLVDVIFPHFSVLLNQKTSSEDKRVAVCLLDDLLEYVPEQVIPRYGDDIVSVLVSSSSSPEPELCQTAVYGIGLLAKNTPQLFRPVAGKILPILTTVIDRQVNTDEYNYTEWCMAKDNAITALGRIIEFHKDIGDDKVATYWLHHLPLLHDIGESINMNKLLIDLLEQQDTRVMGQGGGGGNIQQISAILVGVMGRGTELLGADQKGRWLNMYNEVQKAVGGGYIEGLVGQLNGTQQQQFQAFIKGG